MQTTSAEEIAAKKQLLGIDQVSLSRLSDKKYSDAIDPQFGISNKNLIALKLLSYYARPEITEKPSEEEKIIVQDFLKAIVGDMKFNKALIKILDKSSANDDYVSGISKGMVRNLMTYTYKTRHLDLFTAAFNKLKSNYEKFQRKTKVQEEDKISLSEYSTILDVSKLQPIINLFFQKGFLDGDDDLEKINMQVSESAQIMQEIELEFSKSFSAADKMPGKIVLDNRKKKSSVYGDCLSFFEKIVYIFITKHKHAAKLFTTKEQASSLSHLNPSALDGQFNMRSYLYADIYKIKIEALIPAEQKIKLQKAFGDKWLAVVNGMYGEIEREIHDNTVGRFSKLSASPESEQNKSGVVSLVPFGLGHKKFSSNDFNEIREQIFSQFYSTGQHNLLCSEFVAHTTIAALSELNRRLDLKLREKDIQPGGQIIKIPFGKHEDLHRMHPDRLLHVLKKAGCVEKEKKVPIVSRFFKGKSDRKKAATSEVDQLPVLNTHITQ